MPRASRACLVAWLALFSTAGAEPGPAPERPRLLVLTDISSLTPGLAEPDDGQSLIRLMLYSNEFDLEGLVASSNMRHGRRVRPDLIRQVVDAYARVQPNLLRHDPRYPPAAHLRTLVKAGQPIAGPNLPVEQSVGAGKDTEASDWILAAVDRPDPHPLWVVVWGGSADLAQALWKVRQTRSNDQLDRFLARLRVHSIGDQDSTGPWVRDQFPGLWTITQQRAYRGMYRGGDTSLVGPNWVESHIHGHGPLGDLYPNYDGGDIWTGSLGRVRGIKEGDTPSFLALVPNGLSDPESPRLGSWGGRFEGEKGRLRDVPDPDRGNPDDPDPRMSTVYRWRPAYQADFAARLDWCVRPVAEANHPPAVAIAGDRERGARPGQTVVLDATATRDPDGDPLTFAWCVDPTPHGPWHGLTLEGANTSRARLTASRDLAGQTIPVLLTVTDRGSPALARYGRVVVRVERADSLGRLVLVGKPPAPPVDGRGPRSKGREPRTEGR